MKNYKDYYSSAREKTKDEEIFDSLPDDFEIKFSENGVPCFLRKTARVWGGQFEIIKTKRDGYGYQKTFHCSILLKEMCATSQELYLRRLIMNKYPEAFI